MTTPNGRKGSGHDGQPEYLAKAEAIAVASAAFCRRFVVTIGYAAVFPWRLSAEGKSPTVVPPYSFLSVTAILANRAIRWMTVATLIALSAPFCPEETHSDVIMPPVKDYLSLPTLSELILYSLPLVVIIGLVAEAVSRFPGLGSASARKSVASHAFYAAGLQAFIVLLTIAVFAPLAIANPNVDVPNVVLYGVPTAAVLWPTYTFAAALVRSPRSERSKIKRGAITDFTVVAARC